MIGQTLGMHSWTTLFLQVTPSAARVSQHCGNGLLDSAVSSAQITIDQVLKQHSIMMLWTAAAL